MTEDSEQRIREAAYFRWLNQGQPEGCADQHWHEAAAAAQDRATDEALKESFPASDPPSQTPVTGAGAPD